MVGGEVEEQDAGRLVDAEVVRSASWESDIAMAMGKE